MARFNPDDPDETEGRVIYRARAEGMVRMQASLAKHTVRLICNDNDEGDGNGAVQDFPGRV